MTTELEPRLKTLEELAAGEKGILDRIFGERKVDITRMELGELQFLRDKLVGDYDADECVSASQIEEVNKFGYCWKIRMASEKGEIMPIYDSAALYLDTIARLNEINRRIK